MSETPETNVTPDNASDTAGTSPAAEAPAAPTVAEEVTLGTDGASEAPETAAAPVHKVPTEGLFWGTGRRKSSVARVRLVPGDGKVQVNKRELDDYFSEEVDRNAVTAPLAAVGAVGRYNIFVNVRGGGHTGQAGAILLGAARALIKADSNSEPTLRQHGFLTRDARRVERKKYGQRKARRRFQFSKR